MINFERKRGTLTRKDQDQDGFYPAILSHLKGFKYQEHLDLRSLELNF